MTQDQLRDIFQSKYSKENWYNLLAFIFSGPQKPCQLGFLPQPVPIPVPNEERMDGFHIGQVAFGGEKLQLYVFELKDNTQIKRNRVGLRNMVNYLRDVDDAALVVYHTLDKKHWRVSYICDIIGKTALKRYSFAFGDKDERYTTPVRRFLDLEKGELTFKAIETAFSVEALNKEFFKGYKDQFRKFCDYLSAGREQTKQDRDYVKKLLGRLVFLQFLQKKGWMGVPAANKEWEDGDPNYLQNLIAKNNKNEALLTEVLEPLFFATLNEKRQGDIADKKLGGNIKIPYLNGGLFDKDSLDTKKIDFPYSYFAELSDFFSAYNFTIDENDPDDSEVGIDPEMLGHIFENLLEDNKDKGAFYTPKEIVHYMCRESLVQYLRSHTGEELHKTIDELVREGKFTGNAAEATKLNDLLREVKICDPAIGSGAFPMGLLSEIFHCRRILVAGQKNFPSSAAIKREIIQDNIYGVDIEQGAVDIARLRFWLSLVVDEPQPEPLPNLDYKIMQGNSLLESFEGEDLSVLYKDDEVATDLFFAPKKRQDIIELQKRYFSTTDHTEKSNLKNEINEIIIKHLEDSFRKHKRKVNEQLAKTREIIANFKTAIKGNGVPKGRIVEYQKRIDKESKLLAQLEVTKASLEEKSQRLKAINDDSRPFFLWHLFFKDVFNRGGFDIVIGNPPYIQLQKDGGLLAKELEGEHFETFARTGDIYCLFYEQGVRILRNGGIEAFITSNKWMRAAYGENTRLFFAKYNPLKLIDVGAKVFDSATVDTNILILQKSNNKHCFQVVNFTQHLSELENARFSLMEIPEDGAAWILLSAEQQDIERKIVLYGTPLKEWDLDIYFGVKTGYNEAFIIDTAKRDELIAADPKCAEIIKPILRGRGIDRYASISEGLWIIFIPWHFPLHKDESIQGASDLAERTFENNYPAIYEHLLSHKIGLSERNKAETGIRYEWYAMQRCAATYREELDKEKIVWKRIGSILRFCYDDTGSVVLDSTCFAAGPNSKYLVAVLNSKMGHYLLKDAPKTGTGDLLISVQALEPVRIPMLSLEEQQPFIDLIDQILDAKSANPAADTSALESEIDRMVYDLYGLTKEEVQIIEKN